MMLSLPSVATLVLPLLHVLLIDQSIATSIETGKPHSTVQILTEDNVDDALNDPANGLWLLKFYGEEAILEVIYLFIYLFGWSIS